MRLSIKHETNYRYTTPLVHTIQHLRLTPRAEWQQHILHWQIDTPGPSNAFTDAFGNLSHMLTVSGPRESLTVVARGEVDVQPLEQGRLTEAESLLPLVFTVATRLTEATPAVLEFAARGLPAANPAVHVRDLLALTEHICGAVRYQSGSTVVTSTADHALRLGQGVCQDHAHLFLACCHVQGIPARYVSGYIASDSAEHAETHAWADAWVSQPDYTGWVSIDVTHARLMSDSYCRIAVGRDYDSAAPIRGVRRGGGEESLNVKVQVRTG
jgi:transglutaminase-like putative cysteine protease